jgi:hypothetical protein
MKNVGPLKDKKKNVRSAKSVARDLLSSATGELRTITIYLNCTLFFNNASLLFLFLLYLIHASLE